VILGDRNTIFELIAMEADACSGGKKETERRLRRIKSIIQDEKMRLNRLLRARWKRETHEALTYPIILNDDGYTFS
jgi:hypothetical protein